VLVGVGSDMDVDLLPSGAADAASSRLVDLESSLPRRDPLAGT
jgi:hypothetical protein